RPNGMQVGARAIKCAHPAAVLVFGHRCFFQPHLRQHLGTPSPRSAQRSEGSAFSRDAFTPLLNVGDDGVPAILIAAPFDEFPPDHPRGRDRKSTRLNSSHVSSSYAVFCLKKKKTNIQSVL